MHCVGGESRLVPKGTTCTGAAWLSSARVVRCWVKSRNERNPCELLPPAREGRALCSDCPVKRGGRWGRRQVSMALTAWAAHVLQCPVQNDPRPRGGGNLSKTGPSSDWRLQFASMKPESLVMAHQLRRREYVPGPCTHRPSHHERRLYPKSAFKRRRSYRWSLG